jgi:hypothetical protein
LVGASDTPQSECRSQAKEKPAKVGECCIERRRELLERLAALDLAERTAVPQEGVGK